MLLLSDGSVTTAATYSRCMCTVLCTCAVTMRKPRLVGQYPSHILRCRVSKRKVSNYTHPSDKAFNSYNAKADQKTCQIVAVASDRTVHIADYWCLKPPPSLPPVLALYSVQIIEWSNVTWELQPCQVIILPCNSSNVFHAGFLLSFFHASLEFFYRSVCAPG